MRQSKPSISSAVTVANAVLVSGAGICLLGLIYIAYFYYVTGTREFSSALIGWLFISFLTTAGGLCIAGLKLPTPLRVNVALSLFSIGVSVYAVECASSVWWSLPSVKEDQYRRQLAAAAEAEGAPFDPRTKAQVVYESRQAGFDAVVSMFPQGLLKQQKDGTARSSIVSNGVELLPLASISNKLTVVCNEGGRFLTYTSDEHGFHNPAGIWNKAPIDVAVLGDSFVQGWCVPSGLNFVSIIRQRYPATVSLGIEGDGPLTMLATLREYGSTLRPKVVLWCYFEANDLADLGKERRSALLRGYLTDAVGQRLVARQAEIDHALSAYTEEFMETNSLRVRLRDISRLLTDADKVQEQLTNIMKLTMVRSRLGAVANREDASEMTKEAIERRQQPMADLFDLFRQTLLEAKASTEESGSRLYFVYLTSRNAYDREGPGPEPDRDRILEIAREVGLPIIDIHLAFIKRGDPMSLFPFGYAGHYNEEGHKLVGETILAHLSR